MRSGAQRPEVERVSPCLRVPCLRGTRKRTIGGRRRSRAPQRGNIRQHGGGDGGEDMGAAGQQVTVQAALITRACNEIESEVVAVAEAGRIGRGYNICT